MAEDEDDDEEESEPSYSYPSCGGGGGGGEWGAGGELGVFRKVTLPSGRDCYLFLSDEEITAHPELKESRDARTQYIKQELIEHLCPPAAT